MQLFSKLIDQKFPSFLSLLKFMLSFIEGVFKFGYFLDADVLHFLVILFESLEISLFRSHFSLIVLLEIFASF